MKFVFFGIIVCIFLFNVCVCFVFLIEMDLILWVVIEEFVVILVIWLFGSMSKFGIVFIGEFWMIDLILIFGLFGELSVNFLLIIFFWVFLL